MSEKIIAGPGERCANCSGEPLTEREAERVCYGPLEYHIRSTYETQSPLVFSAEVKIQQLCGKTIRENIAISPTSAKALTPKLFEKGH